MEIRFHNPYRHWVAGLVVELVFIGGFVAVMVLVTLIAAWIG